MGTEQEANPSGVGSLRTNSTQRCGMTARILSAWRTLGPTRTARSFSSHLLHRHTWTISTPCSAVCPKVRAYFCVQSPTARFPLVLHCKDAANDDRSMPLVSSTTCRHVDHHSVCCVSRVDVGMETCQDIGNAPADKKVDKPYEDIKIINVSVK